MPNPNTRSPPPGRARPPLDAQGRPRLVARARTRDAARRALGRLGEDLAADYMRHRGCVVLARNQRTRHGEIDLIARDGKALVFVEVKTRRASRRQLAVGAEPEPLRGVSARQRVRLRRLAVVWLAERRAPGTGAATIRFDAIGIVIDANGALARLQHVEGAW